MIAASMELQRVAGSAVPVLFGGGVVERVGGHVRELGDRVLLVSDEGIVQAGHVARVERLLRDAGCRVTTFTGVHENPTTADVDAGVAAAKVCDANVLVGLGGGSAMDCAKGINFLLTNGGQMADYWGVGKATRPMLPGVMIPTTAGTGSEAQCAALISDAATHAKMACLDKKALARLAVLDPELAVTAPARLMAVTGIDAISHAVESAATTKRNATSQRLSVEAWRLCSEAFPRLFRDAAGSIAQMQLGAHLAGAAIENSMLGAAHACANPLTAQYGIAHGVAIGIMLPHVVRFNSEQANQYEVLGDARDIAAAIEHFVNVASLPHRLRDVNVPTDAIPALAEAAAKQWTATFNPRPVTARDLANLYERAW